MNNKNILLVEDNAQDELLTLRALDKVKGTNRIDVVRDGAEALDYLFCRKDYAARDPAELPVVVLLDLKLPKLSGIEVLQEVRSEPRTQYLPVVILTSSDEERDIVRCYQEGANSYVRKPIGFAEFSEAVGRLGTYWLAVNEPIPAGRKDL